VFYKKQLFMKAQTTYRDAVTLVSPQTDTPPTVWSRTVEDYVKAIYLLQEQAEVVHTNALCAQLDGRKPGTVTGMLRRLAEDGLVTHTPYRGVQLTAAGTRIALALLRTHRLLETYLVTMLGYAWDEVHAEAERLEHHISPRLLQRIAALLGDPLVDPHGDPIPRPDGSVPSCATQPLSASAIGSGVRVARVLIQEGAYLRYLAAMGLVPGAEVQIRDRAPFDGPLELWCNGGTRILDLRLAQRILVNEMEHDVCTMNDASPDGKS
jgi:DtxR family transcriptional regulator, Mn-dependent transcriptional regulator